MTPKKVFHKFPKQLSACFFSTFMWIIYVGYFHLLYLHIRSGFYILYCAVSYFGFISLLELSADVWSYLLQWVKGEHNNLWAIFMLYQNLVNSTTIVRTCLQSMELSYFKLSGEEEIWNNLKEALTKRYFKSISLYTFILNIIIYIFFLITIYEEERKF